MVAAAVVLVRLAGDRMGRLSEHDAIPGGAARARDLDYYLALAGPPGSADMPRARGAIGAVAGGRCRTCAGHAVRSDRPGRQRAGAGGDSRSRGIYSRARSTRPGLVHWALGNAVRGVAPWVRAADGGAP